MTILPSPRIFAGAPLGDQECVLWLREAWEVHMNGALAPEVMATARMPLRYLQLVVVGPPGSYVIFSALDFTS